MWILRAILQDVRTECGLDSVINLSWNRESTIGLVTGFQNNADTGAPNVVR